MIKFENVDVEGFQPALRGMRNPINSWEKSDSRVLAVDAESGKTLIKIGQEDMKLAMKLAENGPVHAKYRRMIAVYVDITAPLYWWKEFDTYKVGTVANSCSTMHTLHKRPLGLDDFSYEHLSPEGCAALRRMIDTINEYRDLYEGTKDKEYWWQMIQLLPASFNQKRTVMMNYEVLANIYGSRRNHKLDEWNDFCRWIEDLPLSDVITLSGEK